MLSALYLFRMLLQGRPRPGETNQDQSQAVDQEPKGQVLNHVMESSETAGPGPGKSAPEHVCPDWTTEEELQCMAGDVYDLIRDIQDPEKPNSLEDLEVVYEDGISVFGLETEEQGHLINVEFTPTVPHCSLATLIGLCIRVRLQRSLPNKHKLDIVIKKGTHATEDEVNKQINDKERIAAAMENPNLKKLVEKCVSVHDY